MVWAVQGPSEPARWTEGCERLQPWTCEAGLGIGIAAPQYMRRQGPQDGRGAGAGVFSNKPVQPRPKLLAAFMPEGRVWEDSGLGSHPVE